MSTKRKAKQAGLTKIKMASDSRFSFLQTDTGCYALEGDLILATTQLALDKTARLFTKNKSLQFDLSAIEQVDSVGVGLLLEWHRRANQVGIPIRYVNLPDKLKAIARVGGVTGLLEATG